MIATKRAPEVSAPTMREMIPLYVVRDMINAMPASIALVNKMIAAEIEKWRMGVVHELAEADRIRAAHIAREHDAIAVHAREKFLDAKYNEMEKMNRELGRMTADFVQRQHAATACFVRRCYGEKIR